MTLKRVKRYRVVAPYVLLRQPSPGGFTIAGLHDGATIDGDAVPDYQLQNHLDGGMIVPIEDSDEPDDSDDAVDPEAWNRPGPGAPHQAWVEYALSVGLDAGMVSHKSRDELAAMFGALETPKGSEPVKLRSDRGSVVVDSDGGQGGDQDDPDGGPARPDDGDSKAAWLDYAVARGADRDEASRVTRAELISRYGA